MLLFSLTQNDLQVFVTADARAPFDCHSLFACGFLVGANQKLSSHFRFQNEKISVKTSNTEP
jgi:hypothetical protein